MKFSAGELIVGTDAFVPEIPPADPRLGYDAASILSTLEACCAAGLRVFDFSLYPELVRALQELKRRHREIRLLGNPSWKCGVELGGQELFTVRDRVLATLYAVDGVLREKIQSAPLSEIRRQWWLSVPASSAPLTRGEISSISLNVRRFERRLGAAAGLADALLLGADYADWLPLLGRGDLLEEMFHRAARFCTVFGIAHFSELTLEHLDKLPIAGHFVPYGRHTAFFSHAGVLRATAACQKPIAATFSLIRERQRGESLTDLIGFNVNSFSESALLIGISSPTEPSELVAAVSEVITNKGSSGRDAGGALQSRRGAERVRPAECETAAQPLNEPPRPYLALALTPRCNYACPFCPPRGEQYRSAASEFDLSQARRVLRAAAAIGVSKVRLTGGEPFLFGHLRECVEYAAELGLNIAINTNGLLIPEHMSWMAGVPGLSIRVNLGAKTPAVLRVIHGRDALDVLRDGLEAASDACILQRLNLVLTRHNLLEVGPLIDLCRELGTAMKIFDLFGVPEKEASWKALYAPPRALGMAAIRPSATQYSEQFGIPTRTLLAGGVHVTIRDSILGTRYHERCEECAMFPCQEGLYCPVVTPSEIRPCRLGPGIALPCDGDDQLGSALASTFGLFENLRFADLFWHDRMSLYDQSLLECSQIVRAGTVAEMRGQE